MARSETDKLFHLPVVVKLGGSDYSIAPLVLKESRKWRAKVAELLGKLPGYTKATTDDPVEFEQAIQGIMVTMPDVIVDLFFDYARDLNRDEIEAIATEAEIADAFTKVLEMAFPLARSLVRSLETMSR